MAKRPKMKRRRPQRGRAAIKFNLCRCGCKAETRMSTSTLQVDMCNKCMMKRLGYSAESLDGAIMNEKPMQGHKNVAATPKHGLTMGAAA